MYNLEKEIPKSLLKTPKINDLLIDACFDWLVILLLGYSTLFIQNPYGTH
jgi:hypothetical protein